MKLAVWSTGLLVAFTGCKDGKDKKPEAAVPALSRPAGVDARLTLALTAPSTASSLDVPHAVIREEEATTLDAYKAELADLGDTIAAARALPDGWVVQVADGELVRSYAQRTLGKRTYRCESDGDDRAAHELGHATCVALSIVDGTLVVPFAMPPEDSASVGYDAVSLELVRADADSPPTPERALEDTGWRKTGKLLRQERTATGFFAVIDGHSGDLTTNKRAWNVVVRTKLDGLDLLCTPWGSPKSAEHAAQTLEACRGLRAY